MKLPAFSETAAPPPAVLGQPFGGELPDIFLPDLAGKPHRLSEVLPARRGALVVFWSGVCSHCVRYDEYLNRFEAAHPELALFVVASRMTETPADLALTVRERRLTFPILHDPGSANASAWFVQQTPRVFLLDSSRRLLYRGAIDNYKYPEDTEFQAYLEPAIAEFLEGRPVTRPETASFGCAIRSVYYTMPKP